MKTGIIMLNSILAKGSALRGRLLAVPRRAAHMNQEATPKAVGISLVRLASKEDEGQDEETLFPTLRQVGVTTQERVHNFSVPCHRIVKLIKLGAINKQISVQYCHYLAHLSRESANNVADRDYYTKYCGDLMEYILRTDKNLPMLSRAGLLCDTATTSRDNCLAACSILFAAHKLPPISPRQIAILFSACLRFNLWEESRRLLKMGTQRMMSFRLAESLVDGLVGAAELVKTMPEGDGERDQLRSDVIETIYLFCEIAMQYRIQFVTKRKNLLLRALSDLQISVRVNPSIKMSARCTTCNTHLPLFDNRQVRELNQAIKNQILKGAEKGLFVNTSPSDSGRFSLFLEHLFTKDKRPIDCVIDGLNIAYHNSVGYIHFRQQLNEDVSRTFKVPKTDSQAHTLINTIIRSNMLTEFKKILVVGKAHMLKWPGLMDFFKKHNINFYSSFNNSKDDLFQLYASTLNPKTLLVTNDFLRDHLAQMDEPIRLLMERWIDTHQVWICKKTLKSIMPTPYEKIPSVDRDSGCFHLPVIDYDQLEHVGVSDPPPHLSSKSLTWFCCNVSPPSSQEVNKE